MSTTFIFMRECKSKENIRRSSSQIHTSSEDSPLLCCALLCSSMGYKNKNIRRYKKI